MRVKPLGHVVLKVKDLKTSAPFYRDVLGLREVARYGSGMVFFSLGEKHHDVALMEIGSQATPADPRAVGLYHVAFKVGDSLEELRRFKDHLARHGVAILGTSDHKVTQSLYITDPDGIEIEVYVDADPSIWREDPTAVATVAPLRWSDSK